MAHGNEHCPACPTHGVCPTCREGWGHYTGTGYAPTVEAERTRRWIASCGFPLPAYTATWEANDAG